MTIHLTVCRSRNAMLLASALFSAAAQTQVPTMPHTQITDAKPIPPDRGAAAISQALKKLHTRASMLMIVAHPDDEDGATLAYEGRGLGVRTNLMQLNRGEGGANVMSSDLWDALGLVRTEELLQAGRYYGVDRQYFSTAADYGFSKTLKEALDQWGHERELGEAVRVVRMSRPLIVASVFVGGPTDGHGHHATAGMLAQEVFNAAGDPKMFPEQLQQGLQPWTPLKVYARVPFFRTSAKGSYDYATHTWGPLGVTNHVTGKWEPGNVAVNVSIPVGTYDEVTGLTYLQIAREGLAFQKSQNGGGEVPLPGESSGTYHRFGSHTDASNNEETFFDGIDTSLVGIATLANEPTEFLATGLRSINTVVELAMKAFSAQDASAIAPTLADGLKQLNILIDDVQQSKLSARAKYDVLFELQAKKRQFNDAILASLGISIEADVVSAPRADGTPAPFRRTETTFQMATPGQALHVKVHLFAGGRQSTTLKTLTLHATSGKAWKIASEGSPAPEMLVPGKASDVGFSASVPGNEPYTRPYFTRANLGESRYNISDPTMFGMPLAPYPLEAKATFEYMGVPLEASQVVQVVSRLEGPGLLRYPLPIGPPVSVALSPSAGVLPVDLKSFPVTVRLHNNAEGKMSETVRLKLPAGWSATPASLPLTFTHIGENQAVSFTVIPKAELGKSYEITAVAAIEGKSYTEGYTITGYTGLRPYFLYNSATYKLTASDVKVSGDVRVGYIEGSGDDVPASLGALGVHVAFLSAQDLAGGDLNKYDTILVGVRAYAVRPDLVANNARLLEYVHQGGVVMVQYNTPEYDHNYGPYPYVMTSDPEEVTNEKSAVQILEPKNPLFTWPNRITSADFNGWIEERGSKFLDHWDPKYTALLETHDDEQLPQKGGLLYARYGKGGYIYNAYAFYRQLPLGVPGAYRLFANMISLPKNPDFAAGK